VFVDKDGQKRPEEKSNGSTISRDTDFVKKRRDDNWGQPLVKE